MCPPSSSLHQLRLKAVFPCSRPPAAAIHVRSEAKKRGSRMPRLLCIGKRSCARVPLLSMSRASSHYLNSPCLSGVTTGVTAAAPQGSPSPPVQLPVSVPEPRQTGSAAQWISCSVGERAPHRYLRLHQTSKQAAVKRQETGKRVIQGRRTQTQGVSWPSDDSGFSVGVPLVDSRQQCRQIICQSNISWC